MSLITDKIKAGDFTNLAQAYSKYRPSYSSDVIEAICGLFGKPIYEIDFVDIGAGTGIWTRLIAKKLPKSTVAVEPNVAMRLTGQNDSHNCNIKWIDGSAENTNLPNNSADLVTMASSFHWAKFDVAVQEFHRILKPGGFFVALWNPRYLSNNPLLLDIESYIAELEPNIKRVSSGQSQHIDELSKKLIECQFFKYTLYLEGMHTIKLTPDAYLGAWESVNDVRAQLGENKFSIFLDHVKRSIKNQQFIESSYKTRAWVVQKVD